MGNIDTHRGAHEAFNRRDWSYAESHFRADANYTDHAREATLKGVAEFIDWQQGWTTALSDANVANPRYIDGGDYTVAIFQGRGTNDGPLGSLPPTNKRLDLAYCEVLHYGADGMVTAGEMFYDQMTMLVQLGHMPPPPA